MTRPMTRLALSAADNHKKAMIAANSGVVALRMAVNPAVRYSVEYGNSMNGIAVFSDPTVTSFFQWTLSSPAPLRIIRMGNRTRPAIAMRSSARTTGPNSGAAMRMNRNEAPHSADRTTKSMTSRTFMQPY